GQDLAQKADCIARSSASSELARVNSVSGSKLQNLHSFKSEQESGVTIHWKTACILRHSKIHPPNVSDGSKAAEMFGTMRRLMSASPRKRKIGDCLGKSA